MRDILPLDLRVALTFDTVMGARQEIITALEAAKTGVHLNVQAVSACDSAGLSLLIETARLAKRYNKTVAIVNIPESITALATFYGLESNLW